MAEGGEKRDPVTHRTPSQMKRHYDEYGGTEQQKKNRAARNAARAKLMKEGKVRKGDGKDVAHKKPLDKGGSNSRSNLTVQSAAKNRGWEAHKGPGKPSKAR